jgi:hypothetical protein
MLWNLNRIKTVRTALTFNILTYTVNQFSWFYLAWTTLEAGKT